MRQVFGTQGICIELRRSFARMDFLINQVAEALADIQIGEYDSQNDLLSKIEAVIRNLSGSPDVYKINNDEQASWSS